MLFLTQACGGSSSSEETSRTIEVVFDACAQQDHPARLTNHESLGQVDHCADAPSLAPGWTLLTNWGTKPEWLTPTTFVFVSNLVGDVYEMDIETGEIQSRTAHFQHAGFTRVHVLSNGDLLLLGPTSGPQPPLEPLVPYDVGMWTGKLFVLRKPYDKAPIPLGVHGWEGIAVSRETMEIAWSTTAVPFWVANTDGSVNLGETALAYANEPSEIQIGTIEYDTEGGARIVNARALISKEDVGPVFLEPQDFVGPGDASLLISAYGVVDGFSNRLIVDVATGEFAEPDSPRGPGYDEWEGILPGQQVAFLEFFEPDIFDIQRAFLMIYDFDDGSYTTFVDSMDGGAPADMGPHEPVFSDDGHWVLTATHGVGGWPGYSAGILLFDMRSVPSR